MAWSPCSECNVRNRICFYQEQTAFLKVAVGAIKCEDGPVRMEATFARRLRDVATMDDVEATQEARKMMAAWADAGECYETLKRRYEEQRAGNTGWSI